MDMVMRKTTNWYYPDPKPKSLSPVDVPCVWQADIYDSPGQTIGIKIFVSAKGINVHRPSSYTRTLGLEEDYYCYNDYKIREALQFLDKGTRTRTT